MKTITINNGSESVSGNGLGSTGRKVLHNVFLLDRSGSMNQGGYRTTYSNGGLTGNFGTTLNKYQTAINGINNEIAELKTNEDVDLRISVFEFSSSSFGSETITEHYCCTPISEVKTITGVGASGNTPLYQSLGYVIERFLRDAKDGEQVLIKIFTDGYHNCPWGKYGTNEACRKLIKDVETNRNFIITFVGTEADTRNIINTVGIYASNTVSYDGTSRGLQNAFTTSSVATKSLAKKMKAGYKSSSLVSNFYNDSESTTKVEETNGNSTTTGTSN